MNKNDKIYIAGHIGLKGSAVLKKIFRIEVLQALLQEFINS